MKRKPEEKSELELVNERIAQLEVFLRARRDGPWTKARLELRAYENYREHLLERQHLARLAFCIGEAGS